MSDPTPVRVVIGDRWHLDTHLLLDRSASQLPAGSFDAESLLAPIDLVIDGRNLTAFLPDERVIPFVLRLAEGLKDLAGGTAGKALIEFEESPWELAVSRHGDGSVTLALYEVASPGRVAFDALPVSLSDLIGAMREASETMVAQARTLPPSAEADALLDVLSRCRALLRLEPPFAPPLSRLPEAAPEVLTVETRSSSGLTLQTRLRPAQHAIISYIGEHSLDRHALLVPGQMRVLVEGSAGLALDGRPLTILEEIGDALHVWLARWPTSPERVVLAAMPEHTLELRARGRRCSLEHRAEDDLLWATDLPIDDLLTGLLDHIVDVVARCVQLNPYLETNERIAEMRSTAVNSRHEVIRVVVADRPERSSPPWKSPKVRTRPTAPTTHALPHASSRMRRMTHEHGWSAARRRLRFPTRLPDGRGWIAASDRRVETIGGTPWSLELNDEDSAAVVGEHVLVARGEGSLELHKVSSDRPQWSHNQDSVPPVRQVDALWVDDTPIFWAHFGRGMLAAFDAKSGRATWIRPRAAIDIAHAVTSTAAIVLASEVGELHGIDPATGETVWRQAVPFELVTLDAHGPRAVVIARDPTRGQTSIGVLDTHSGRWVLNVTETADLCDVSPVTDGRVALLLARGEERYAAVLDLASGSLLSRISFFDAAPGAPRGLVSLSGDQLFVQDGAGVRAYDDLARQGLPKWTLEQVALPMTIAPSVSIHKCGDLILFPGFDCLHLVVGSTGRHLGRIDPVWERLRFADTDATGAVLVADEMRDGSCRLCLMRPQGFLAVLDGGRAPTR